MASGKRSAKDDEEGPYKVQRKTDAAKKSPTTCFHCDVVLFPHYLDYTSRGDTLRSVCCAECQVKYDFFPTFFEEANTSRIDQTISTGVPDPEPGTPDFLERLNAKQKMNSANLREVTSADIPTALRTEWRPFVAFSPSEDLTLRLFPEKSRSELEELFFGSHPKCTTFIHSRTQTPEDMSLHLFLRYFHGKIRERTSQCYIGILSDILESSLFTEKTIPWIEDVNYGPASSGLPHVGLVIMPKNSWWKMDLRHGCESWLFSLEAREFSKKSDYPTGALDCYFTNASQENPATFLESLARSHFKLQPGMIIFNAPSRGTFLRATEETFVLVGIYKNMWFSGRQFDQLKHAHSLPDEVVEQIFYRFSLLEPYVTGGKRTTEQLKPCVFWLHAFLQPMIELFGKQYLDSRGLPATTKDNCSRRLANLCRHILKNEEPRDYYTGDRSLTDLLPKYFCRQSDNSEDPGLLLDEPTDVLTASHADDMLDTLTSVKTMETLSVISTSATVIEKPEREGRSSHRTI